MSYRIAVAGKGGTGKTTLSALLCRGLIAAEIKPLLAVDADPNSCLAERLGVTTARTIGQLREELRAEPDKVPKGIAKSEWIERLIHEEVAESIGFDVIVMGRQEGPDCYCYINNLLRSCLETIGEQYRAIIIDNEAGLEHLSRRTNGKVDVMLIVCEPTMPGARTAVRIRELMNSLDLSIGNAFLVLNRCGGRTSDEVGAVLEKTGLETLGCVPDDPAIVEYELQQKSLMEMPGECPAVRAVDRLLKTILERR